MPPRYSSSVFVHLDNMNKNFAKLSNQIADLQGVSQSLGSIKSQVAIQRMVRLLWIITGPYMFIVTNKFHY